MAVKTRSCSHPNFYLDGRIILRWILRKWGVDWIEPAEDRDRWQALVNVV